VAGRALIEIRGLWKAFEHNEVLRGVDLSVLEGETLVVLGPSGCGKSVLLKHVIGLMRPDSGSVLFDGHDIGRMTYEELSDIRKRFGMVFQGAALFDSMTVGENVGLPLKEHKGITGQALEDIVERKLGMVGLADVYALSPSQISGGMKKRVALARAIALDPEIVLFDEPTTGLDPVSADVINELILRTQRALNTTAVVVTHDMASVNKVADRVVMLFEGRLIIDGTPDEIRASTDPVVRRFIEGRADETFDPVNGGART
jgi:phospholipid/cholesterol/gamma-HCH transport system ATP-binding protein